MGERTVRGFSAPRLTASAIGLVVVAAVLSGPLAGAAEAGVPTEVSATGGLNAPVLARGTALATRVRLADAAIPVLEPAVVLDLSGIYALAVFLSSLGPPPGTPSDWVHLDNTVWGPPLLLRIRRCESSDNYAAISRSGTFRGAYQFMQPTWDVVASRNGREDLVGVPPDQVAPGDQDQVAVWNFLSSNPYTQWPVCSRR